MSRNYFYFVHNLFKAVNYGAKIYRSIGFSSEKSLWNPLRYHSRDR